MSDNGILLLILFVLLVIVVPLLVGRVCQFNELEWDE